MTLYKGAFNYFGENIILRTVARNRSEAFENFITTLVPILETSRNAVRNHFIYGKDYYSIEREEDDLLQNTNN